MQKKLAKAAILAALIALAFARIVAAWQPTAVANPDAALDVAAAQVRGAISTAVATKIELAMLEDDMIRVDADPIVAAVARVGKLLHAAPHRGRRNAVLEESRECGQVSSTIKTKYSSSIVFALTAPYIDIYGRL